MKTSKRFTYDGHNVRISYRRDYTESGELIKIWGVSVDGHFWKEGFAGRITAEDEVLRAIDNGEFKTKAPTFNNLKSLFKF